MRNNWHRQHISEANAWKVEPDRYYQLKIFAKPKEDPDLDRELIEGEDFFTFRKNDSICWAYRDCAFILDPDWWSLSGNNYVKDYIVYSKVVELGEMPAKLEPINSDLVNPRPYTHSLSGWEVKIDVGQLR